MFCRSIKKANPTENLERQREGSSKCRANCKSIKSADKPDKFKCQTHKAINVVDLKTTSNSKQKLKSKTKALKDKENKCQREQVTIVERSQPV